MKMLFNQFLFKKMKYKKELLSIFIESRLNHKKIMKDLSDKKDDNRISDGK